MGKDGPSEAHGSAGVLGPRARARREAEGARGPGPDDPEARVLAVEVGRIAVNWRGSRTSPAGCHRVGDPRGGSAWPTLDGSTRATTDRWRGEGPRGRGVGEGDLERGEGGPAGEAERKALDTRKRSPYTQSDGGYVRH